MATFCAIYCIPDDIHQPLRENKITGTHAFSQIMVTVRGLSPLPLSHSSSTTRTPAIRPSDPPYVPPNIRAAIDSHR